MSSAYVYADNQLHPCDLHEGQEVSFIYLPQGQQTRRGKERPVAHATLGKVNGRTVWAQYQEPAGLFRNRLVTKRVVVLRRMHGANVDAPAYRVDDFVTGLQLGD